MKKLSKILESTWGDMVRRAEGESVRREDDVDLMDMEEFYEYIQKLYSDSRLYIDIHHHDFISVDEIPVYGRAKQLLLVFDWTEPEKKQITLPYSFRDNFENVFNKLTEKFSLECPEEKDEYGDFLHNEFIYIHPMDGKKITNRFYIEVLDYIIKEANGNLTESTWGDMMRRAEGEVSRKEDFLKGTYEYLCSKYQVVNTDEIEYRDDYIIFSVYRTMNTHATISINNNKIVFSSMYPDRYKGQMKKYLNTFKDELYAFYDKIKKTYSPEIEYYDGYDHWIDFEITPKGGMTKEFCVEFIDFVLDNMPEENKHIIQLLCKK